MDFKKIIVAVYVVGAIVAGVIFTSGIFAAQNAVADKAAQENVTSDEDKEKMIKLQNQLDDLAVKLNAAEGERASLEVEKEDLARQVEDLKRELDAAKAQEAEEAKADDESGEDAEAEEEEDSTEKKNKGPYYTYKVNTSSAPLRLYNKKSGGSSSGRAPKGYVGYVVDMGSSRDNRVLILFKGELHYASKSLLKLSEIDAEDYPDKVAALSADDIGEEFFKGKAVGIEKDN